METGELDIDEQKTHEIIVLSGLKNIDHFSNKDLLEIDYSESKDKKEKTQEELNKIKKIKEESMELHYKLENEKSKELESIFNSLKLKIQFKGTPKLLREGMIYTESNNSLIIYDNKFYNKLYEIKFEEECEIITAILLDNKDLVLCVSKYNKENYKVYYEILIYKIKDKKYSLIQKIEESQKGYTSQYVNHGFCSRSISKKEYKVEYIKEISGNRFICVTNYGYKIYSLNEKENEYSLVLLNKHLQGIKIIYEINPNKFIFGTEKETSNYYIRYNNIILIEIIELNKITEEEINCRLKELDEEVEPCFGFFYRRIKDDKSEEEKNKLKKLISSLQLSSTSKIIIESSRGDYSYLNDYLILKNKSFIVMLDNHIIIIDLINGKILKKYSILVDKESDLIMNNKICMKKWNNNEDNEFILFMKGNIILFELNEDENEIKLKIINITYFPDLSNYRGFEKIKENMNKFYIIDEINKSISLY